MVIRRAILIAPIMGKRREKKTKSRVWWALAGLAIAVLLLAGTDFAGRLQPDPGANKNASLVVLITAGPLLPYSAPLPVDGRGSLSMFVPQQDETVVEFN